MTVASYRYDDDPEARPRSLAGGWIFWGLLAIVSIIVVGTSFVPSDYVIERPGEATPDVLGTIDIDGSPVPFIDIPSQQTYPTTGSLHMLTVSTIGNRESHPSWFMVFQAWLDPTQEIIPVDEAFPEGQTTEQSQELSAAQMTQSQQAAIAAALGAVGYDYDTTISVGAVAPSGPSVDVLIAGDVITAINSTPATDALTLRSLIAESGTELPLTVTVLRDGTPTDLVVTPVLSAADEPQPIIGIEVVTNFVFPFDVTIQQGDIGGPSAGQIFALAIIDKLTPGALVDNLAVAGTGTITPDGEIGAIGGITQKLYGAQRAGATIFLAPASNCDDIAAGSVPDGLDIYAVSTLADSLAVLNTLTTGAGTSLLPRCPVS
jgi:PDZ domain-containing protein